MSYSLENEGVLEAVILRFNNQRLPRIMDIKSKVDQGDDLNDFDMHFLNEVFHDTQQYAHFVSTHEEFHKLYSNVTHLYHEITSKALENENKYH